MLDLTFGEQVKIILSRKGMTIKELAERIEASTGKKMSRQNLTQRLSRDNFQEQDMRMIAEVLGCPFSLNILDTDSVTTEENTEAKEETAREESTSLERDITVGEFMDMQEEASVSDADITEEKTVFLKEEDFADKQTSKREPAQNLERDSAEGEINPYTGREYETNSVRTHPKRIGYVQVYDGERHQWTDMTEWAFMGYQERKKALQGDDYVPPIYLE